jgi:glycogen(starch) synthase
MKGTRQNSENFSNTTSPDIRRGEEKLRILQWLPLYLPDTGGIENAVHTLMGGLDAREFEFAVAASHGGVKLADQTEYDGIPVHRFHYRRAIQTGALPQIIRVRKQIDNLKRSFRPDIVHIHFSDPSFYFHLQTLRSHPSRTIVTLHNSLGYMGGAGEGTLVNKMLKTADWVTGVSARTLLDAKERLPEIETCSSVIHNGLPALAFEPKPLQWDRPRLLCLGRLVVQKGFDVAIDAVALLVKRLPNLKLTVAGTGIELDALQKKVSDEGLERYVDFIGAVSHERALQLMNESNVILMPSRFEGFPLVALEAAQIERPLVATHVDGLGEAVLDGETGILIHPEDPVALAGAVISLFEDPDRAQILAGNARERVNRKFGLKTFLQAYEELYRRVAGPQNS